MLVQQRVFDSISDAEAAQARQAAVDTMARGAGSNNAEAARAAKAQAVQRHREYLSLLSENAQYPICLYYTGSRDNRRAMMQRGIDTLATIGLYGVQCSYPIGTGRAHFLYISREWRSPQYALWHIRLAQAYKATLPLFTFSGIGTSATMIENNAHFSVDWISGVFLDWYLLSRAGSTVDTTKAAEAEAEYTEAARHAHRSEQAAERRAAYCRLCGQCKGARQVVKAARAGSATAQYREAAQRAAQAAGAPQRRGIVSTAFVMQHRRAEAAQARREAAQAKAEQAQRRAAAQAAQAAQAAAQWIAEQARKRQENTQD